MLHKRFQLVHEIFELLICSRLSLKTNSQRAGDCQQSLKNGVESEKVRVYEASEFTTDGDRLTDSICKTGYYSTSISILTK